jgi:hypothetical protein
MEGLYGTIMTRIAIFEYFSHIKNHYIYIYTGNRVITIFHGYQVSIGRSQSLEECKLKFAFIQLIRFRASILPSTFLFPIQSFATILLRGIIQQGTKVTKVTACMEVTAPQETQEAPATA